MQARFVQCNENGASQQKHQNLTWDGKYEYETWNATSKATYYRSRLLAAFQRTLKRKECPLSSPVTRTTLGVSLAAAKGRGRQERKLQGQGKEAKRGEATQSVSLLHLPPVELWLRSSRQRWVLIPSQMARGPEAKKMTETCYVASSAWGRGVWRGGGVCICTYR